MRSLPIGVPRVLVSTVASGDVAPYVGPNDITMMYSVVDVAGLNRISRVVLANAAHALAGMMQGATPAGEDKPAIGLTMFGVTTACVDQVRAELEARYDCLVFHATGTGGPLDGEAGRLRHGAGLHRQHHYRGVRPPHGRRLQRRWGPARRLRAHGSALCRLVRGARHGELRRARDRAGAVQRPHIPHSQSQCHADAHDAGRERGDGRVDRGQAQCLPGAGGAS